jgi:hypothetical protein
MPSALSPSAGTTTPFIAAVHLMREAAFPFIRQTQFELDGVDLRSAPMRCLDYPVTMKCLGKPLSASCILDPAIAIPVNVERRGIYMCASLSIRVSDSELSQHRAQFALSVITDTNAIWK